MILRDFTRSVTNKCLLFHTRKAPRVWCVYAAALDGINFPSSGGGASIYFYSPLKSKLSCTWFNKNCFYFSLIRTELGKRWFRIYKSFDSMKEMQWWFSKEEEKLPSSILIRNVKENDRTEQKLLSRWQSWLFFLLPTPATWRRRETTENSFYNFLCD